MPHRERIFETIRDEIIINMRKLSDDVTSKTEQIIENIDASTLQTLSKTEDDITDLKESSQKIIEDTDQLNKELLRYAYYMTEIAELLEHVDEVKESKSIDTTQDQIKEIIETNQEETPVQKEEKLDMGILKRGLSNGHIVTQDDRNIFIPESIIRKHEYNHGDIIRFTPMKGQGDQKHYYFTLIQKSKDINKKRQSLEKCLVEYDRESKKYFTRRSISGEKLIEQQDEIDQFILSPEDVNNFHIHENSLIDLAWYKANITGTIKIAWRH